MYKCELERKSLQFKIPAKTSRGTYAFHNILVVHLEDEQGNVGYGECAPLPDLSSDRNAYHDLSQTHSIISSYLQSLYFLAPLDLLAPLAPLASLDSQPQIVNLPALTFALESALLDIAHPAEIFSTPFAKGEAGIPINGLIWMSDYDNMLRQIEKKLADGFRCIKLKIGAINWSDELALLDIIRQRFSANDLTLRVDANGAFPIAEAMRKLDELAAFDIHSIEQPIRQGNEQEMAFLCENSPVPIALDEELIGIYATEQKMKLLDTLKPQYIVVKPTLHGGLSGAIEWVALARKRNIGSWLTSALESNIGLRSIALLAAYLYGPDFTHTSNHAPDSPLLSPDFTHSSNHAPNSSHPTSNSSLLFQGLGTGQLFVQNTPSTLHLSHDLLFL